MSEPKGDIALIGLAVMGQNLILNMNDHGFTVVAFNRTVEKVEQFLQKEAKGTNVIGAKSLEDMVSQLKKPRRVMLLVKAGPAVDAFIDKLVPLLEKGDIIIDGGNSEYTDTNRRCKTLQEKGILFVGSGVSGGEDGARYGPSLMPGGSEPAWSHLKNIFQSISAKANDEPCCDWVGPEGAGHFVKMVHNGIEYGDMQLICEAYHLMKDALGMNQEEMANVLAEWNKGELDSYLIEISTKILQYKDKDGSYLLEKIRDTAGQKGTGKWTAISALDYGVPVTLIGEAVFARCLSALQEERKAASKELKGPSKTKYEGDKTKFIEDIRQALYASKIVSYAQGFMLMRQAAKEFNWDLNYGGIALMWRGGCIIRRWLECILNDGREIIIPSLDGMTGLSVVGVYLDLGLGPAPRLLQMYMCYVLQVYLDLGLGPAPRLLQIVFLGNIKTAFDQNHNLSNLLLDDFFKKEIQKCQESWRRVVASAVSLGIPTPAFSTALAFFDGYRSARLPANLLQAQRDYFGAHTYELLASPGTFHHTNWTGHGGDVSSTQYQV